MMLRAGSEQRGFTILELVLVVLLMALAVGISYPSLTRGNSVFQIKATGRNVLNLLRYAREKAITEQRSLIVTVDREGQKVVFSEEFGDPAKTLSMPHSVRIAGMTFEGHEVTQGQMTIRYLPNGGSDNAGIVLNSNRGTVLQIVTDPITGGARIITGEGENAP